MKAIQGFLTQNLSKSSSCIALSIPEIQQIGSKKPWLCDSYASEIFAKFRIMNCELGNRYATTSGFSSKTCVFCGEMGIQVGNNDIHLVIECPSFQCFRDSSSIRILLTSFKAVSPNFQLYRLLLNDTKPYHRIVRKGLMTFISKWKNDISNKF